MKQTLQNAYNFLKCYAQIKKQNTLDKALDFAFSNKAIKPIQVREEFESLLAYVKKNNPKVVVEIGTAKGGTLFMLSRAVSDDAILISIDQTTSIFRVFLYKAFRRNGQMIRLIRKDSHGDDTLDSLKGILDGKNIDFIFIDGDHTYEGVKKDFER